MQKRRRILFFLLSIIVLMTSSPILADGKTLKIAMIQWRGETEACKGFKDGLHELGYAVQYTVLNAAQNRKELGRLLRYELEPKIKNFDYIYTYGTTVSKAVKDFINNQVPQVFSNVAAPLESGVVLSMEASGENISGTSNRIPISLQIETISKIIPFKRLGVFFNPREKNAMVIRQELYDMAKQLQLDVIDLRSPPVQDILQEHLQKLIDKSIVVDAVYLPLDSFLITRAELIGTQLRAAKIKSIGAQKQFIEHGALLGIIPDYYRLGKVVATIVDRHQKGESLHHIPIQTAKDFILMVNKTTADLLHVAIPEEVLKKAVLIE